MYDPTIATVHHELVSVERGSQVDVCGHFSHMNIWYEPMHVRRQKRTEIRKKIDREN
jgi:hypothetical protein